MCSELGAQMLRHPRPRSCKVQSQNRIEALVKKENTLAAGWAEQDLIFAQRIAWELLPLLRVETRESKQVLTVAQPTNKHRAFRVFHPLGRTVAKRSPASQGQIGSSFPVRHALRRYKKYGRDKRAGSVQEQETEQDGKQISGTTIQPAPLRFALPESKEVPFERRYRGEGPLERGWFTAGKDKHDKPTPLAQHVARLEDDVTAIVRVVLEPLMKCNAVHLNDDGEDHQSDWCHVRCVVKVEAYLPCSSKTLTLRVQVDPGIEVIANGDADEKSMQPEQLVKEKCQSRKRQRQAFRESRAAEAKRGIEELSTLCQEAAATSSCAREQSRASQGNQVNDQGVQRRGNNAFSILLVSANIGVPVRRVDLGSGSWRETVGEMIGCPPGQELRAVRTADSIYLYTVSHTLYCCVVVLLFVNVKSPPSVSKWKRYLKAPRFFTDMAPTKRTCLYTSGK